MEQAISLVIRSPLVSFRARNLALFREEREVPHNPPLNAALFKWAFEEVGGYTEEYGYPGEDVELDAELTRRGYKLYYLPNVLVYHKHRSTFRRFIRQMFGYGKARVRVGRRFRRYFEFQHYGPIVLTLMTFSPLFFIPMAMSLVNGLLICFRARKPLLFPLAMLLTWSFYVSYGLGEITQFLKGR
jgi:GT2 family glycosyltransferase